MKIEMAEKLNRQINMEFYSAYFYLNISNYYVEQNLDGFANWFTVQEQEERDHAFLILRYLQDNDSMVLLEEIPSPGKTYADPEEPLKMACGHEKKVTASIHMLYETAMTLKDYQTMEFLNWFIREQREEEKSIKDIRDKFRLFARDEKSLYMLDSELKTRVYTPTDINAAG